MARAGNKMAANAGDVKAFIDAIEDPIRKRDARKTLAMMKKATGEKPVMWGASIVGFGVYHYRYASGREGDFMKVGFSPRKNAMTLYIMPGFSAYDALLKKLGKHSVGKSCLYVKNFDDVDPDILDQLIRASFAAMTEKYG